MCVPCDRVKRGNKAAILGGAIHEYGGKAFEAEPVGLLASETEYESWSSNRPDNLADNHQQSRPACHLDSAASAAFPPGRGFGGSNPLSPCLGAFECDQLPSGPILLMLKFIEL